jgi:hypothetical protein
VYVYGSGQPYAYTIKHASVIHFNVPYWFALTYASTASCALCGSNTKPRSTLAGSFRFMSPENGFGKVDNIIQIGAALMLSKLDMLWGA